MFRSSRLATVSDPGSPRAHCVYLHLRVALLGPLPSRSRKFLYERRTRYMQFAYVESHATPRYIMQLEFARARSSLSPYSSINSAVPFSPSASVSFGFAPRSLPFVR